MTYQEAVDYIEETPKFTKKHTLEHTRECLRRLGSPEKAFRVIHVAGTNGKGSTCACLDSVLRAQGYSCGMFTSPHLVDIRERFRINGQDISQEGFLAAFDPVYALSVELERNGMGHPTYFEMLFLMGMLIFRDAGVQYVVLETGLGGRLDATTAAADPLVCVITSISLDHMQYLGDTTGKIAEEKAGILVPGVPVIYDGNDAAAAGVIQRRAEELGCPAVCVTAEDAAILHISSEGIDFEIRELGKKQWHISFIAQYQVMNAMLAVRTLLVLQQWMHISMEAMDRGLQMVSWPGRMERILPGVIVDGAHNEDGVRKFVDTAKHFQKEHPIGLLFSAVEDKDYKDMIHTILRDIHPQYVVTTQVGGYRQVDAEILASIFRDGGCTEVTALSDTGEAFETALRRRPREGMLFCVGSLYLVGEVKEIIEREMHD